MENTLGAIIGGITLLLSIAGRLIGFPHQIKKIHQTKNVDSISLPFFGISFLACLSFVIHGIMIKDWVTIISQSFGTAACGIVVVLYFKYRKLKNK